MLQVMPGMRYQDVERLLNLIPGRPTYIKGAIKCDIDTNKHRDRIWGEIKGIDIDLREKNPVEFSLRNPAKEDLLRTLKLNYLDAEKEDPKYNHPVSIDKIHWNFNKKTSAIVSGKRAIGYRIVSSVHIEIPHDVSIYIDEKMMPEYVKKIMSEVEKRNIYIPKLEITHRGLEYLFQIK